MLVSALGPNLSNSWMLFQSLLYFSNCNMTVDGGGMAVKAFLIYILVLKRVKCYDLWNSTWNESVTSGSPHIAH